MVVDGIEYIRYLEDYEKAICCLMKYARSCATPDVIFPMRWEEPPACSEDFDG